MGWKGPIRLLFTNGTDWWGCWLSTLKKYGHSGFLIHAAAKVRWLGKMNSILLSKGCSSKWRQQVGALNSTEAVACLALPVEKAALELL